QYMNDMNPKTNIFAGVDEALKQEVIIRQTCPEMDIVDNEVVEDANELVNMLFATDSSKMYKGIKVVWEQVADKLVNGNVSFGPSGNWKDVSSAVKSYKELREHLRPALSDFQDELGITLGKGGRER